MKKEPHSGNKICPVYVILQKNNFHQSILRKCWISNASQVHLYPFNKQPYRYWFDFFYWFNMLFFCSSNTILCHISSRRVSKQGNINHRMIWVIRKKLSKVTIVDKSSWKLLKTDGKQVSRDPYLHFTFENWIFSQK